MIEEKMRRISTLRPQLAVGPEDFSLAGIISILKLTNAQRSVRQNFILQEFTKHIKFFKELTAENGDYVHRAACERLTYEFVPAGQLVFRVHSYGNKFYIIIEGRVSIQIQTTNVDDEIEMKTVNHYSTGMAFGELALIKDQPRSASILCEVDCHFAVLNKEDYLNIIGKIEARKLDLFIEFLLDIPTFRTWTKKRLELLTYHFSKAPYKRKQVVFTLNSPPEFVFIVLEGEFELTKTLKAKNYKDKEENFILKIALLTKGEVFGDEEVLKNRNHSLTCTCYSTTGLLLTISAEDFKLKVTEDLIEPFKKKEKSKNLLRSFRLENFQNYITSHKKIENNLNKRITVITPFPLQKSRPKTHVAGKGCNQLSFDELEKIKKRALGREIHCEEFLNLSIRKKVLEEKYGFYQDGVEEKEEKGRVFSRSERSSLESVMKCHRPGGYFRGNLKKCRNFKSASLDRNVSS